MYEHATPMRNLHQKKKKYVFGIVFLLSSRLWFSQVFPEVVVHRIILTTTSVLVPDILFRAPYSIRTCVVVADFFSCSIYSIVCFSGNELMTANHNDGNL